MKIWMPLLSYSACFVLSSASPHTSTVLVVTYNSIIIVMADSPKPTPLMSLIQHPSTVFIGLGFPLIYSAYRDYRIPLEDALRRSMSTKGIQQPSERQVGAAVASRALRVATKGSFGVFSVLSGCIIFSTGCSTISEAVQRSQEMARSCQEDFCTALGLPGTGSNHPDFKAIQGMSEDEELEFIAKKFNEGEETS